MSYESNMELTGSETPAVKVEAAPISETPASPEVKVDAPATPTPVAPKEETPLYELPDGRKVDASTLQTEWKENFLPEFTRKSQRLAEIERGKENINKPQKDEPAWKKADYVPENYAEVIELAKKEAINEIQNSYQQEQERIASIQREVDTQVADLKKIDAKLDENALFQHANKYGFRDLKTAHSNMADMKRVALETEQRTVKNLKVREADPISTGVGGELPDSSGYDPNQMSRFDSAGDYLAFLKGKK